MNESRASTAPAAGVPDLDRAELDVREVPKAQRHPLIFARFAGLAVGESFVLVNGHDPKHLREEFERDHPGAYGWDYLAAGADRVWRIRITRRTAGDLPRVLANTTNLSAAGTATDAEGAVWRTDIKARQLDANVIRLAGNGQIDAHVGPDLDVLLHVLRGSGQILTAAGPVSVTEGALVWLPRRSRRAIVAGPDGLTYLSVHQRRPGLSIGSGISASRPLDPDDLADRS
jgi:uncharacterized protein (DUF2249 family)